MTKQDVFKKAHQITRNTRCPGDSYQVTFAAALRMVYANLYAALPAGCDIQSIKDAMNNKGALVTAPYNKGFIAAAKRNGGRWNPTAKGWMFEGNNAASLAKELVRQHF